MVLLLCILLTSSVSADGYKIYYYHNDHLGNPVAITNEQGDVVWEADYEPFGGIFDEENIDITNKYNYNSKELDTNTNLLYYGNRFYDSNIGRFTTADTVKGSLGNPQSLNRYVYTLNNPLKYVDPTGNRVQIIDEADREQIIGYMNTLTGSDVFSTDKEGYVKIAGKFSGNEDQKKLFKMFKYLIKEKEMTLNINIGSYSLSGAGFKPGQDFYSTQQPSIHFLIEEDSFKPLGKDGEYIKFTNIETVAHEMGHAYGYFKMYEELYSDALKGKGISPTRDEVIEHFTNYFGESIAVSYENVARKILGMGKRHYYKTFKMLDTGELRAITPQLFDEYFFPNKAYNYETWEKYGEVIKN